RRDSGLVECHGHVFDHSRIHSRGDDPCTSGLSSLKSSFPELLPEFLLDLKIAHPSMHCDDQTRRLQTPD
ncbi:hypothetical protein PENTCL1PPCAC_21910, partial [Pristionchus entomophagus]